MGQQRAHPARAVGRFTVGSGEVAHLFRRLGARTLKMLSVKRGRAGRLDVRARTLREMAPEIPTCWKRLAEAHYARMKSYYTAVSTSAAVLVGMLTL